MDIVENVLDEERCGSQAKCIENKCRDLDAVNCRTKALELDRPMSFIAQIMCLVVDQKLKGLKAFEFK